MTGGAADVFAQHDGRDGVAPDRGEQSTVTDTRLGDLVATSRDVREASRRLDKVGRLAAFLGQLGTDEIEIAVAFLCGALPQGRIGVGFSALSEVRSAPAASAPVLTLAAVDSAFEQVAATRGRGSTAARVRQLRDLLARATGDEQDFLLRLLYGEIRQGALESVITDAVARAAGLPAARVRRAVMMAGGLGPVARVALGETDSDLSQFSLRVFHPVQPMLAQSADGVDDALARLGAMALDYKLDGARVQVHKDGTEVRVFTRHLREVTAAVPEVVETVGAMPPRRLILDGEVLALGPAGTPLPFQVTMRRFGRKLDVDALRRTLPLTPFFFDCLLVDGQDLIDEPFGRRADALAELAGGRWLVRRVLSPGAGEAAAFVDEARRAGHEGVMAKSLGAGYAAGSRGAAWLKIKQAATLDLVVLAAEWGSGRRSGWLSNLHLGARDTERNGFVMLGKTFKGLTDKLLEWQTRRFLDLEIGRDPYTVFVRPELVVEIAFNDVQASPQYPGGVALRFARVKRYRDDKTAAEADTIETVQAIHRRATGQEGRPGLPGPTGRR